MSPMDFIFHFMQTFNIVRIIPVYVFFFFGFAPWMCERVHECCLSQFYPLPVTSYHTSAYFKWYDKSPYSGFRSRNEKKRIGFFPIGKEEVNGKKAELIWLEITKFQLQNYCKLTEHQMKKKTYPEHHKNHFPIGMSMINSIFFFFNQYLCAFQRMPNIIFYWKAFFIPRLFFLFSFLFPNDQSCTFTKWCVVFSTVCLRGFCTHVMKANKKNEMKSECSGRRGQ